MRRYRCAQLREGTESRGGDRADIKVRAIGGHGDGRWHDKVCGDGDICVANLGVRVARV